MATKRSKTMLSSPENAMSVNPWMKNSWAAQASAEIPVALNKEVLSVVGRAEGDRPRSDGADMGRKHDMGSCREGSVLMTTRVVPLPRMPIRYRRQIGMQSQTCPCPCPGIPIKGRERWPFPRH